MNIAVLRPVLRLSVLLLALCALAACQDMSPRDYDIFGREEASRPATEAPQPVKPPEVQHGLTEDLGLMLYDVFDPASRETERNVSPRPVFFDAAVKDGRMDCHPDRVRLVRPGTGRV